MPTRKSVLVIAGWTIVWAMTLMLTFIFLAQGWSKFSSTSGWARAFNHWGYPVWFRVAIGVIEVMAALLILWPRSAPLGAAMIIAVMLGGMGTHIVKDHSKRITSELLSFTFATVILVARRGPIRGWTHPRSEVPRVSS